MADALKRFLAALRRRVADLRDDVRESTDPSLLGILRFFGLLYGPIDRRARVDEALKKAKAYRLAGHVGWRHALGGITYLLLAVLVVTGVLLSFYYRPSVREAYPSLQYIVSRVPFGWLVRDLHVWPASLIVIVALAHMARVFFDAAYKPPRETNWLIGLLLLIVVLAFGATGYLLPWDQWAYWSVTRSLDLLAGLPVAGSFLTDLLRGDELVSGATLSRYFALHVIILPWLLFALVLLHFTLVRKHGVASPKYADTKVGPPIPFYPDHLLRSLMVSVLTIAVLITLAALFPRPMADMADPGRVPASGYSTWVFVDAARGLVWAFGGWGLALASRNGGSGGALLWPRSVTRFSSALRWHGLRAACCRPATHRRRPTPRSSPWTKVGES